MQSKHPIGIASLQKLLTRGFVVTLIVLFYSMITNAQSTSSYEIPIDARSVAMGESFVAVAGNVAGLKYNPASLAMIRGVHVLYANRDMNWTSFTEDFRYSSYNVAVQTPVAILGFSYDRLDFGKILLADLNGNTVDAYPYEHTFILGAAHTFDCGLSVGASAKTFHFVNITVRTPSNPEGIDETTLPILFDLGFQHTLPTSESAIHSALNIGASLQNFGSNVRYKDGNGKELGSNQPDRFLRAGLAFNVSVNESEEMLTPFRMTTSLEYRRFLNGYSHGQKDFYGFGIEMTLFDIVDVRGGGFLSNITWVYGEQKKVAYRYGVGVNLPLRKLGATLPVVARFDYAVIPLNERLHDVYFAFDKSKLTVFSIQLSYEEELF
ncbi:MAG: hypothetical protein HY961_05540 [Ignavibacteriae bacterium]|nr:hypothetical protein [Ignavibacteriota bacterium]